MKIKVLIGLLALLSVHGLAQTAVRPNFSGTWVLDKDRSYSNPAGLDQTLMVTHTGEQVKVEAKVVTTQGERLINETYTLDGKQVEFNPPGAPPEVKGQRKAAWLPDGRGLLITDEVKRDTPNGPVPEQTIRKWLLSPDGGTLTVDYYFDGPRGSFEARRVFTKKQT